MRDTYTSGHFIFLILHFLLDDQDTDSILEHAGIAPERMVSPDSELTISEAIRITQSALTLSEDPALGLHIGQELGIEMLDMVGMMASTAPTARAAIQSMLQYSPLVTNLGHAELREEATEALVVLHLRPEVEPIARFCGEIVFAASWNISRRLLGMDRVPTRITFRHSAPPWADEYRQVLGEETLLEFDAPEYTMAGPRAYLDQPMPRHSPGFFQRLQEQAARRLASRMPPETTTATVRRLIEEHLGEHLLDLTSIAQRMGLTPRTLQRRLKEEGTNFQVVFDDLRLKTAQEELLERDTDIETLAAMLGYSEPANFYRAFKAWTGLPPGEFRRLRRR